MQKTQDYLNDEEAARYLRLSPQTLRNWRSRGNKGPVHIKAGRRVLYAFEDLKAFMDSNKVQTAQ